MKPNSFYVVAQLSVAIWAISIAAPVTPFSTCTTPRSIACGLSGKPRTHLRANTQSLVPAISLLPRPVPSSSYRIPSIWRICRHTDRARSEISSIRKRDHFVMNMCNLIAFVAIYMIFWLFLFMLYLCICVMSLYGIEPLSGPSPGNDDLNTKKLHVERLWCPGIHLLIIGKSCPHRRTRSWRQAINKIIYELSKFSFSNTTPRRRIDTKGQFRRRWSSDDKVLNCYSPWRRFFLFVKSKTSVLSVGIVDTKQSQKKKPLQPCLMHYCIIVMSLPRFPHCKIKLKWAQ